MKDIPVSDWMNFDSALVWIQEYDRTVLLKNNAFDHNPP